VNSASRSSHANLPALFCVLLASSLLANEATHFVLFEKKRFEFFEAIVAFLKEMQSKAP
jgi:hypothetical protein